MAQQRPEREERVVKSLTTEADQELALQFFKDLGVIRNVLIDGLKEKLTPGKMLVRVFEAAVNLKSFIIQPRAVVAPQGQKVTVTDRKGNNVVMNQLSISFWPTGGMAQNTVKYLNGEYTAEPFSQHRAALLGLIQGALMSAGACFVLATHSSGLNSYGYVQDYNLALTLDDGEFREVWPVLKALSDTYDRNMFYSQLADLTDPNSDAPTRDQLESIVEDGEVEGAKPYVVNMAAKAKKMLDFLRFHEARAWYWEAMEKGAAEEAAAKTKSSRATSSNRSRTNSEEAGDASDEDIPF